MAMLSLLLFDEWAIAQTLPDLQLLPPLLHLP
jgi:hypothetical protein